MKLPEAEDFILQKLRSELPETLYYHGLHHTLDVVEAAERLAQAEGIENHETLDLIRIAALFHDAGFVTTYMEHEAESCRLARRHLPEFEFTPQQIARVCGMIKATKIPQRPKNLEEEIICDADLDYLGRDDFEIIAASLYQELRARHGVTDEKAWNAIQIKFLQNHRYHTATAHRTRHPAKMLHLQWLKETKSPQI